MSSATSRPGVPSVAVVGAGIIGSSIAWRLAQCGFAVTVYDKSELGRESSWAGAGMLAPGGEIDAFSPLAQLALDARTRYKAFIRELENESGVDIDYQECGALELCYSAAELDLLAAKAERQSALGIVSKPVTAAEVKAFWPRVALQNLAGGRFYPDDAIVDPRDVLKALHLAARSLGVQFYPSTPVEALVVSEDEVVLRACGAYRYSAAVIAAGAWSGDIKVAGTDPLPCSEPVKGHLIGYQQPAQTCSTILRHQHSYLLQRANGMLIVGASVERVGFDPSLDPAIIDSLVHTAGTILPHLAETTPSEAWIGFRPASEQLQTGPWQSPRLHLAYGHFRNGILLAPLTAALCSEALSASL